MTIINTQYNCVHNHINIILTGNKKSIPVVAIKKNRLAGHCLLYAGNIIKDNESVVWYRVPGFTTWRITASLFVVNPNILHLINTSFKNLIF